MSDVLDLQLFMLNQGLAVVAGLASFFSVFFWVFPSVAFASPSRLLLNPLGCGDFSAVVRSGPI